MMIDMRNKRLQDLDQFIHIQSAWQIILVTKDQDWNVGQLWLL